MTLVSPMPDRIAFAVWHRPGHRVIGIGRVEPVECDPDGVGVGR